MINSEDVTIVQARMLSTRPPNKVMKPMCGEPMIDLFLKHLAYSKRVNQVIVATPVGEGNSSLVKLN